MGTEGHKLILTDWVVNPKVSAGALAGQVSAMYDDNTHHDTAKETQCNTCETFIASVGYNFSWR